MKRLLKKYAPALLITCYLCCNDNPPEPAPALFTLVSPAHSGIDFKKTFTRDLNDITGFETGAGVSAGDINNDGLPDLIFAGGYDKTRLFLNKGSFKFEDITEKSGIFDGERKCRTDAALFADVNGDGWLDIYYLKYGVEGNAEGTVFSDYGANLLFINQKNLTFKEESVNYGLNISGFTLSANFFDYDNDGDLDLILLNGTEKGNPFDFNYFTIKPKAGIFSNMLLENMNVFFTDVSEQAGISKLNCAGQSVITGDVNNDGWTDIFIANDFFGKDLLYLNNGNKTFTEQASAWLPKSAMSSMGADFADINNDGWLDLFVGEMLPEDAVRRKMNVVPFSIEIYLQMLKQGMGQYARNMLHLHQPGTGFRDIGFLAGVEATEWSWGALFADFDNDGWNDLVAVNGIQRDLTNMDFVKTNYGLEYSKMADSDFKVRKREKLEQLPSVKTPNYIFRNRGDLTFEKMNVPWGIHHAVHTRGVVYADLDNDGDLDLALNNMDTLAFIYKNNAESLLKKNYIKLRLAGENFNTWGLGSRVYLYANGKMQMKELSCMKGFHSSPEPLLHFGLHETVSIDSLKVVWLSGKTETKRNLPVNQFLVLYERDAAFTQKSSPQQAPPFFRDATAEWFAQPYTHQGSVYNDFKEHRLFHRMFSKENPVLFVNDANRDGLDDLHIFDALDENNNALYVQQPDGKFKRADVNTRLNFFTGFAKNISCLAPFDLDNDGVDEWFLGGRIDHASYPKPPGNFLLKKINEQYADVTDSLAPGLKFCGMATAAVWADYNNDGLPDLIVAGEWMPLAIFENQNGRLIKVEKENGLQQFSGWWNSIAAADFDNDGDIDFIAGNHGLNSVFKATQEMPVTIYAGDFDKNGTNDPVVFHYISGKNVPFVNRDLFCEHMPFYNNRFYTFENFAKAGLNDILSPEQISSAYQRQATMLASVYIENLGNGNFSARPLPNEAQLAPVYGIVPLDINGDGNMDVVLTGNSFSNHFEYGNLDALGALALLGDGKGNFHPVAAEKSGLYARGDAKCAALLYVAPHNIPLLFIAQHNDSLKIFRANR